mgnify:CR=1 FL=1
MYDTHSIIPSITGKAWSTPWYVLVLPMSNVLTMSNVLPNQLMDFCLCLYGIWNHSIITVTPLTEESDIRGKYDASWNWRKSRDGDALFRLVRTLCLSYVLQRQHMMRTREIVSQYHTTLPMLYSYYKLILNTQYDKSKTTTPSVYY